MDTTMQWINIEFLYFAFFRKICILQSGRYHDVSLDDCCCSVMLLLSLAAYRFCCVLVTLQQDFISTGGSGFVTRWGTFQIAHIHWSIVDIYVWIIYMNIIIISLCITRIFFSLGQCFYHPHNHLTDNDWHIFSLRQTMRKWKKC